MRSLLELNKELKERTLTCTALVEDVFKRIQATDAKVKAYVSLMESQALEQAHKLDVRFDKGDALGPLAGIPLAVKDNICIKQTRTTCSSKMLEKYISPFTATSVQNCLDAGMIPIGKTNLDEFAMGSSTENSAFFTTRNPWHTDHAPGGSSGGSAATVAAAQVPVSLGSDTGGSIRQPASFCGVVGVKPTYGRVSRYGLVAFASSLDQIGTFSRSVEDAAAFLNVICGHDRHDATSLLAPVPDFTAALQGDVNGLRIAVPNYLLGDMIDDAVKERVIAALDRFKRMGATWDSVEMDSFKAAIATYYILAPAEASSNLARFDGVRYTYRAEGAQSLKEMFAKTRGEGFGPEVKRRIILGTYVLSSGYYDAFYLKAQKARTLIKEEFDRVFQDYDLVLNPTTATTAFKLGEKSGDPLQMYLSDIATIPANMAGLPAMSLPCGLSDGLPVGFQLTAKALDEETLLKAGYLYQKETAYHQALPEGIHGF